VAWRYDMDKDKLAKVWMWINLILGALGFILFVIFGIRVIVAVVGHESFGIWVWNVALTTWFFITSILYILVGLAWKKRIGE